jgi:hypothetical protein
LYNNPTTFTTDYTNRVAPFNYAIKNADNSLSGATIEYRIGHNIMSKE